MRLWPPAAGSPLGCARWWKHENAPERAVRKKNGRFPSHRRTFHLKACCSMMLVGKARPGEPSETLGFAASVNRSRRTQKTGRLGTDCYTISSLPSSSLSSSWSSFSSWSSSSLLSSWPLLFSFKLTMNSYFCDSVTNTTKIAGQVIVNPIMRYDNNYYVLYRPNNSESFIKISLRAAARRGA